MFLIESGGQKLLYTGDYRSHGRMDFDRLLAQLPNEVDMLITEGTTLTREEVETVSEDEIESMAFDEIRKHSGPVFVVASSTNISRMVSMFKATRRNQRLFAYDAYAAQIALMSKKSIPNPDTFDAKYLKVFIASNTRDDEYAFLKHYPQHKIGRDSLAQTRFVAMIRSSMLNWVKRMASRIKESTHKEKAFENGLLIYSMQLSQAHAAGGCIYECRGFNSLQK